jgi:S-DNA-T family DNA segregation ATPase FtsK/SpoIIIE
VHLSLVERVVLVGGGRGSGKSSGLNVFVTHAAKSPDVELLLIDPNRVQLGPWADRALVFADHRVDDAIDTVRLWRDEIDRRTDLFASLPQPPVTLTRQVAHQLGLPMWLLVIDELAYHTSVAGTPVQQKEFYRLLRDGVARGRAAGMAAIVATQRPTHDLIPTSLRDLFDIRIAYRTMTRTSSDVILGDDFARHGYSATDIDIAARGVAWLLAEGAHPVRTKTAWIPPHLRAELAATSIRYRPDAQPPPPHRDEFDDLDDLENR